MNSRIDVRQIYLDFDAFFGFVKIKEFGNDSVFYFSKLSKDSYSVTHRELSGRFHNTFEGKIDAGQDILFSILKKLKEKIEKITDKERVLTFELYLYQ